MTDSNLKYLLLLFFISLTFYSKAQLQANFSADTTQGCEAISALQFNDLSTGNPSSWLWDFGNGNTSTLQNPIANYPTTGQYTVKLTVTSGSNQDTETKTNYIQVYRKPNASFTVSNNLGCPPLPVSFTNTSSIGDAPISSYIWDFGDGSQPNFAANPNHLYQTSGTYPVSLQITDQNNCSDNQIFNSITVTVAPIALFSTSNNPSSCTVPHTVNFVNNSQGTGVNYLWDFGDGNTSTAANPSHTYTTLGSYNVSLIASDANCSDTLTKNNFVQLQLVDTQFSMDNDSICFGLPFKPINNTQGATLYSWQWGDGTTSNQKDASHVYPDSGWYRVRLVASNGPVCIEDFVDSVYVQRLFADFTTSKQYFCQKGDTTIFTATGINADYFHWNNRDANPFSNTNNPYFHVQNNLGVFNDTLLAVSKLGCELKVVKDSNRLAEDIRVNIVALVEKGCEPLKVRLGHQAIGPGPFTDYFWNFKNGDTSILQNPDTVTFDTAGIYNVSLEVTNNLGCKGSGTKIISVGTKQIPNFTVQFDTICPYDTIIVENLSSDTLIIENYKYEVYTDVDRYTEGGSSYERFKGFSDFKDTGYYSIELMVNDRGCERRLELDSLFYVKGPIVAPSFIPNCTNRRVIPFYGGIKGATRFYWDFGDGSPIDSINRNPTHTYPKDTLYYPTLIAYNDTNTCSFMTDTLRLDLRIFPPLDIFPYTDNYCLGDTTWVSYMHHAYYPDPYWLINGDTLDDSTVYIFRVDTVGPVILELLNTDLGGCPHSDIDTIYVYQPKADFTSDVITGCVPHAVNFMDSSTHDTTISLYRWNFGQGSTSNMKDPTITYTKTDDYPVSLYIENIFGCYDSIIKYDYITHDDTDVDFNENRLNICQGETVNFRNLSSGNNPRFEWNFGDGSPIDTAFSPIHQFNTAGDFDILLTLIDANGCRDSLLKPARINVQPKPTALFTSDTSIANCYPLAVNFSDQSIGNVISWNWTFGDLSNSIFQNPFHNYTLPGKYDVSLIVATSNGCKDTLIIQDYIQTEGPIASFTKDKDTICINESVRYEITSSNNVYNYTWDFGDGNSATGSPVVHTYSAKTGELYPTLILSDSIGACIVPLKDTLFVQNVKADFDVSDTLGCGIPYSVDFSNQSIGAATFKWNINNTVYTSNTTNYTFNQYGTYWAELSITSNIGCIDTNRQKIVISPKPTPSLTNDMGICIGDSILLQAGGGVRYDWSPISTLTFVDSANVWAKPDSTTSYQVIAYNEAGCSDSLQVKITIPQIPANFEISDTSIYLGESFQANVYVGEGFNYVWSPARGLSCSDCFDPIVKPLESTTYIINIFDDYGCYNLTDTLKVDVEEVFTLDAPTAFSPNGDQLNDVIYAKGYGIKDLIAFKIYNRHGELVFESTEFENGWDGTYKGKPQPIETYVYTLEAVTYNNETLTQKGNITLIR